MLGLKLLTALLRVGGFPPFQHFMMIILMQTKKLKEQCGEHLYYPPPRSNNS